MKRIKFRKGQQRKFLKSVLSKINCPSLRELINRGFDVPYSTLKNYYTEKRFLPENLFKDFCYVSKISPDSLNVLYLKDNWGQIKGGLRKN